VVVKDGRRGNYAIQKQREPQAKVVWVHVDELKRYRAPQHQVAEAKDQAEVAAQPEYVMEAIVDHRGNWNRVAEREFLVKWLGYEEEQNSWEAAANLNNNKAVQQYVREVKREKKKSSAVVKGAAEELRSEFIEADLLKWDPQSIVQKVCDRIGVNPSMVRFLWASPPCRTMSNAPYNVGRGEGHGYNYRDFSDPQRGPCCSRPECKYRQMAVEHDQFLPMLQQTFQEDRRRGLQYDFMVENPGACLRRRPYALLHNWPDMVQVALKTVSLCAFKHPAMKPTDLFTSLVDYTPRGETGS